MLIDDEENILNALIRILRSNSDWDIETYSNPVEALKRAKTNNFDLFLSDYRMPEMDGVELLSEIKVVQPESMRLILSGFSDLNALISAINQAEIYRFITKPWEDYELISTVKQALQFKDILVENRRLADQVRDQKKELDKRKHVLQTYKDAHPELFLVKWSEDGSIILNDSDP